MPMFCGGKTTNDVLVQPTPFAVFDAASAKGGTDIVPAKVRLAPLRP
tara:strand:- start:644 stop:784 length:141 start_codon:yes stop_codon:yes gene_type:complete